MNYKKLFLVALSIGMLFLYACGPKAVAPQAELDTPEHHVSTGNKLLKRAERLDNDAARAAKLDEALSEFNRAKALDPKFSPAYVGIGLVYGFKGDHNKSFKNMKKAKSLAVDKEQELDVLVGYMRLYILAKNKVHDKWLKKVEALYHKAVKHTPDTPKVHYYMGEAYKLSYMFREASLQYTKVLDLDKDFVEEADKQYAIVQKIERAMPGTSVGKKIALLDKITRADIAALFIEELRVDELFENRTKKEFDTAYHAPDQHDYNTGSYVKAPDVTDIDNHVLKADIKAVMAVGIKGLQPFPDHTYQPYKTITRAEFAIMIEDILVKIIGDDSLATRFIGNVSPFPDLRGDLPYFNAAMVCTTRNIMEVKEVRSGEFGPHGVVPGSDALLSLRALKTQLKKY